MDSFIQPSWTFSCKGEEISLGRGDRGRRFRSRLGLWKLFIVAFLIGTGYMRPQGLGIFINQERIGALGTGPIDRFVPGNELTIRIFIAPVKDTSTRTPRHHFPTATQGTGDLEGNRLGGLTFGVLRTGEELSETAHLDHHRAFALWAFLVRYGVHVHLDRPVGCFLQALGVLAFGIL